MNIAFSQYHEATLSRKRLKQNEPEWFQVCRNLVPLVRQKFQSLHFSRVSFFPKGSESRATLLHRRRTQRRGLAIFTNMHAQTTAKTSKKYFPLKSSRKAAKNAETDEMLSPSKDHAFNLPRCLTNNSPVNRFLSPSFLLTVPLLASPREFNKITIRNYIASPFCMRNETRKDARAIRANDAKSNFLPGFSI